MTATATRDATAKTSIMTPMAGKIAEEHLLPLMQYVGIKEIELTKNESANLVKIVPSVKCFEGTPDSMVAYAMLVKDALAILLASIGMPKLAISADKGEEKVLVDGYEQLDAIYKAAKVSDAETEADKNAAASPTAGGRPCIGGKCASVPTIVEEKAD